VVSGVGKLGDASSFGGARSAAESGEPRCPRVIGGEVLSGLGANKVSRKGTAPRPNAHGLPNPARAARAARPARHDTTRHDTTRHDTTLPFCRSKTDGRHGVRRLAKTRCRSEANQHGPPLHQSRPYPAIVAPKPTKPERRTATGNITPPHNETSQR